MIHYINGFLLSNSWKPERGFNWGFRALFLVCFCLSACLSVHHALLDASAVSGGYH